jgi:dienelactone hydrolase
MRRRQAALGFRPEACTVPSIQRSTHRARNAGAGVGIARLTIAAQQFWRLIDYGGLENDDVFAGKQWMVENNANIDPERVGIIGWSHGGMISLMNIFNHPKDYKVAYAGVPVSDLVARMGYKSQSYRELFSAPYHIGKTADENVAEYRKRSPAWNAEKLQTALLIHTNTNDEDVNALEVEHLIAKLKAAGKQFEYKIYQNAPGGHAFNRLDTKLAKESRAEVYRFLALFKSAQRDKMIGWWRWINPRFAAAALTSATTSTETAESNESKEVRYPGLLDRRARGIGLSAWLVLHVEPDSLVAVPNPNRTVVYLTRVEGLLIPFILSSCRAAG